MEDIHQNLLPPPQPPPPSNTVVDFPPYFRCPISMELMQDPVTISTGVSFERANIEKWFFTYNKKTCPATMQTIVNFDITPNYTLKRLILSWKTKESSSSSSSSPSSSMKYDDVVADLLKNIESTPFKASSLKKLRLLMAMDDVAAVGAKPVFVRANGFDVLVGIITQVAICESADFANFEACEEALGVLSQFPFSKTEKPFELLSRPEAIKSMAIVLQRGSMEGRFYAMEMLQQISKKEYDWNSLTKHHIIDLFKSILELASDEIIKKASTIKTTNFSIITQCRYGTLFSSALELLIEIMESSKKSRLLSIEAGAVCVMIDLLPDSNRSKCEKILHILKLLSECAEGRSAMGEHIMGIATVTKKMSISNTATKIGMKILWLICNYHPSERVLEEMMGCGTVKKLLGILNGDGRSSTKEKAMKIMKLHGSFWRRFPCFPYEFRDYLKLINQ
ncbi:E3 ubiquitin-protein ligase PUB23-like [Benincasa hispida]|uniref:E3 ubiquitin-protein ligase PUB23-like n=1 Tax=Benincasa hispida TaxID=102211 RepID=UPI0018FFC255|nr:E3 ubiquitin-protein ligase PUB23-like [Benincasa hispida]